MLTLNNVSKSYQGHRSRIEVVRQVSLEIKSGDFISIRGGSGAGKSTLLLMAGGLLAPEKGNVAMGGRDLYSLSTSELARFRLAEFGFVFQEMLLLPYLTVRENVLTTSMLSKNNNAQRIADDLLLRLKMTDRASHYPSALSTGEKQRVAFARALLNGPKILFADEPTGNLDPDNGAILCTYFEEFARAGGAVVIVTHDATVTSRAALRYKLADGKLTKED